MRCSLIIAFLLAAIGLGTPAGACDSHEPADDEARNAMAQACAQAGQYEIALGHYAILLQRDADNADWLLGKARTLLWAQRPREAVAVLEHARAVAPAYEDLWRINLAALDMLDDYSATDALLADAERRFPAAAWHQGRRAALHERYLMREGTRAWLWLSTEELSGGREPWRAVEAGLDWRLNPQRRVLAGLHAEERFDDSDLQLSAAWVERLGNGWAVSAGGDVAPAASVLPEWSLVLEAGRALPGGRSLGLRARHASFATVDVDSLSATLEQYVGALRLSYTLTAAQPSGLGTSLGHGLRVARDYGSGSHVTLALGFGEEAETIAPSVVLVTRVKSASLNGVHWNSAAWGLSWELGWHEQGDFYRRLRLRLGLEHRF